MQTDEYRRMYELEDHYWWFVGRRNLALKLLRKYLPKAQRPTILDLGCGTGVVSRELSQWSEPISLDMSPLALRFCQERNLTRPVLARSERLPLQDGQVDAVVALDILEHVENDIAAFAEASRVLRPGGIVILSVPAFRSLWGPHDVALMHHRRYRKAEVKARLQEAGLEPIRISYSVFFLFPVVVGLRVLEKRKKGPAKASLIPVPEWMNRALIGLQSVEASMIAAVPLPWGSSVIAVARKPVI